ncbi:hypothetical protein NFI96_029123 [Prochilodus magdalenae]|nr:hypothetical protein NFI96_029123 [Prochilodus magdalenae]
MEIQSAKEDGYLTGLAYLDTARGINPIVERLPHALQEKWISCGSKFKAESNGQFPPFSFFAAFISHEARTRNDPSFAFASNSNAPLKEKTYYQRSSSKYPISVHKTDIYTEDDFTRVRYLWALMVAFTADIKEMFHCFLVREDHRNFLRFLWFRDNDLTKDIIEYRMKVHVFGNRPSPAIAIYRLRRAAEAGEGEYGTDTRKFIQRHFYGDDALMSLTSDEEAIDLLKRTKASLAESNLHLHKIASNSQVVMEAFPPEDHAKVIKDLDFTGDTEPTQRSLGLRWEIQADTFTFRVTVGDKPYTRRGVLSTVNSLFDPLGFVAPVTIRGRALLRELTSHTSEWDKPLPEEKRQEWETWRDSLKELKHLHIPRKYTASSLSQAAHTELCVFSDASTKAIGAVAYIRSIGEDGKSDVGFVFWKAQLAPQSEPTIPRLELCAAVMAVEIAEFILSEMDLQPNAVKFYSDSKVVLGYIHSQTKRFYVYVHNRVQRIRQSTKPEQWLYVPSEQNPLTVHPDLSKYHILQTHPGSVDQPFFTNAKEAK